MIIASKFNFREKITTIENSCNRRSMYCYLLFVFFIITTQCIAQSNLDKSRWKLIYEQEFTDTTISNWLSVDDTLSLTSKEWISGGSMSVNTPVTLFLNACHVDGEEDNPACKEFMDKSQVQQLNSNLLLTTSKNQQADIPWLVSEISSTHDDFPEFKGTPGYIFGMFEVRCKLPRSPYSFTSFWLDGNAWPPEIDAFESAITWDANKEAMGDANTFFSSVHWNKGQEHKARSDFYKLKNVKNENLYDDFHTYTIVWTPFGITWYFDGTELKTDTNKTHLSVPFSKDPLRETDYKSYFEWGRMHMILDNVLLWPDLNNSNITFDPFVVDYVKVYRPLNYQQFDKETFGTYMNYYHYLENLYSANNAPYKNQVRKFKKIFGRKKIKRYNTIIDE